MSTTSPPGKSFQDQSLRSLMFDEVHSLAEWVATSDDLLDKRQLAAQGINVIRYRRQRSHGRNMVVSSTSELRILHVLVRRRLAELSLGISEERLSALAKRMIDDIFTMGDIVLRAAKRGVSAGELIGLVLSRALVRPKSWAIVPQSLGFYSTKTMQSGSDSARKGSQIYLPCLHQGPNGDAQLRAITTEAKYINATGLSEASRKSRQQLRHTVSSDGRCAVW